MPQKVMNNDEKYKSILTYENRTAQIVAAKVIDKPELSAWMILIPIVLIPFMQRYQKYKETAYVFSGEYLYTKRIALDIAYKMFQQEITYEQALELTVKTVRKNPDAKDIVLKIYEKQILEIELLCMHYVALLNSKEEQYDQMVFSHYQKENEYLSFINRLAEAEREVNQAAAATFKDDAAEVPEIMEKMEKVLLEHRLLETKKFFPQRS